MAETFKCAFLVLAFVTSFQILFIEGRPIKPANKQQLLTYEKEPIKELASKSMNTNLHHSTADNQKVSLTSPPVHIPSVHHSKADRKESPPMVPRSSDSPSVRHPETPGANSNNGQSVNAFKDDFEPTTPGHSPGVGHIHADKDQDDNEDVDPKAPSSGSSTERAGAAFKPTKPGHSRGVGHMSSVDQSDKIDPNPSNIEHSITTPGHSLGFGHILAGQDQDDNEDVDPKAPSSGSSTGRVGAAFKPTKPGHSPGVGHMSSVDQSDKIDPNPSNYEHSITTPGHSPGFGHILAGQDQDDSEDDAKETGSGSSIGHDGAAFKPTTPGHSPGVGHMSSVDQSDKIDPNPSKIEHSVTIPGHSPGVSHIHADEDQDDNEDVDPKAPGSGSSTGRAGAAFKPTKPGHSPGVGHMSSVDQSDKIDPNPSNYEHSITTPGHSPGFGHILAGQDQDDSEDDAKETSFGSSIGRDGAAFKPTTPGYSPGIGHMSSVDQSDKTNPNPSKIEHSVTIPGHSLGISHIHADEDQDDNEDVDPKAPGSGSSTGRAGAAFKPTKPGHSPGVGHMLSVDQSDKTDRKASNFKHYVTTPGHSPRVSPIHANEDQDDNEDVDPKAPGSGSSTGRAGAAFKPTKPGHNPGIGHMSSMDHSDKTDPKASNFEHSVTTPGHSPGFGHIHVDEDQDDSEDVDPKAPGSGSSTGHAGAAFKPTKPGHSPGVGHMSSMDQSDKTDPKPSNIDYSVSRVANDFQPTLPGHSTRVGHVFEAQTKNS
ncbi:hypothetical protein OIU84_029936 [Salix udensis]|uniref:Uncharacterized protein n=1 Tax=Salix udensis TaxID=889485 RepID=A0AAD6KAN8_9ROSI|nr:hypothetical protein OIU84_029936 [Salix udensis]